VARRRRQWKKYQGRLDPRRLVFIDETWAKTNMTPIRGWAPRGHKLVARAPFGKWRTLTFLAALRHDRIDAPCVLDGQINEISFTAYVEQFLVPTLAPGDIVIMDNLGSHKGKAVRAAILACHARRNRRPEQSTFIPTCDWRSTGRRQRGSPRPIRTSLPNVHRTLLWPGVATTG